MGSMVESTVGCFRDFCFIKFSVAQVLINNNENKNNYVFPTWTCALGFNNNNNKENNFKFYFTLAVTAVYKDHNIKLFMLF